LRKWAGACGDQHDRTGFRFSFGPYSRRNFHSLPCLGSRFNGFGRGARCAAFEMRTAQWEISFHWTVELQEVKWNAEEISPYLDCLADFRNDFHDIRRDPDFADCPDPHICIPSEKLGLVWLTTGSGGMVHPSVRHDGLFSTSSRSKCGCKGLCLRLPLTICS
jgi:hypothetical protein